MTQTKTKEALKLAIEFIESVHQGEWAGNVSRHDALEACKAALAEQLSGNSEQLSGLQQHIDYLQELLSIAVQGLKDVCEYSEDDSGFLIAIRALNKLNVSTEEWYKGE